MTALAALLAAAATWLIRTPAPEPRLRAILGVDVAAARRPRPDRLPQLAASAAAVGAFLLVGGPLGVAAAIGCLVAVPRLARRLESGGARRRREGLERQAPVVAELLAATLSSGASLSAALSAVSDAVGAPACDALRPVLASLALGADPALAWQSLADEDSLRPIGDALARSATSGAPLAGLLGRLAEDLRRGRQHQVEVAARGAGVRAVAPLGACFLPAFVLVGVVPVVVSLAGGLLR